MSRLLSHPLGRLPRLSRSSPAPRILGVRFASEAKDQDIRKKYSATLLLPKTDMPLRVKNPPATEDKFRHRTTDELYREQYASNEGPVFVLHDGPPYANGNLHMGHALNKILKDMINRYNVIRGRKVHYIPGWDCHGLPIEHKALAALGKSHTSLDPVSVRQEARKFALEAIDVQKAEMKQLGVMADWDNPDGVYRTLDHEYEIRQLKMLQMMVSKGFITHRLRPTYYSPSSRTALAEAELEYTDLKSTSVYVAFPVAEDGMTPRLQEAFQKGKEISPEASLSLAIWTTTPWTLPANMGVSVHNEIVYAVVLDREKRLLVVAEELLEPLQERFGKLDVVDRLEGKDLVGTKYRNLFHTGDHSSLPTIFAADYVTPESGTGLVHSAPGHGHDDYDAFQAQNIPMDDLRCPVDDEGHFTSEIVQWSGNEAFSALVGKYVLGAGAKLMIEQLKNSGVLLAEEKIEHRYPIDWRTKKPIIIRATPQWFCDVGTLKPSAVEAIENINFVPPNGRNRLSATVLSRSEWCISRQRSWGVPIPSLFNAEGEPLLTVESLEHIISVLREKGVDHWWSGSDEEFVPPSLVGQKLTKGFDTLDVWFDSGTSWSLIADAHLRPASEPLADVYLEGSDQHRGWFQSSILIRLAALEKVGDKPMAPYRNLVTHGFCTDEKGNKMSKSLGNGISPMDVVNGKKGRDAFGSDTLRVWAAGADYTRDASIGPSSISHAAEVLRKLRSTLRFMLANTASATPLPLERVQLTLVERYVLHELSTLEQAARAAYNDFTFNKVLQGVASFTSSTLSSFYFDVAKDTLYCDPVDGARRQAIIATQHYVLSAVLKIVAPIVPHLAEEVYEAMSVGSPQRKKSVFLEHWTDGESWIDTEAADHMAAILAIRNEVLGMLETARQDKHVRVPTEAAVYLNVSPLMESLLKRHAALLPSILGVSSVEFTTPPASTWSVTAPPSETVSITLAPAPGHQCPRCWLYTAPAETALCGRCDKALGQPAAGQ
ncbi:mitochondrial putative Isoleucyl-tRNA synthetase [Cutaneotrichosporon oleaginosum]|uniref:isoleucine--tRNA ligase n=1 Tax=Cutaneotrichosporon oleaginosum TaxID=879819 RepID=A0A0J0XVK5_9TREE|nr:mitochondrial putative Isoleucyl-tRNA synthetase [Cutaneotrichosporon oleaginosum]KLT45096.1 mitochondrial putative Isoleucyl-tRNA synthetase [Cutaneotrichosporon oleaginosum]TXT09777.1 hypothetical protein COLE_03711 [Cutaneotrichosporon oleaginosum]